VYKKIFDDFIHNIEHGAGIHYMEETMAKRINVSIPDKLYSEIQKVKKWLIKEDSVSKIVQKDTLYGGNHGKANKRKHP
jgi:hypothetical protein